MEGVWIRFIRDEMAPSAVKQAQDNIIILRRKCVGHYSWEGDFSLILLFENWTLLSLVPRPLPVSNIACKQQ